MPDPNAVLTGVTITFSTHNDDKDDNTGLSVSIENRVSIFLSQDIAKNDNLAPGQHFNDPSTLPFSLPLSSSNIKLSDLTVPVVNISISPSGNDRWIFDFVVQLAFNDGSSFSSKSVGVILDQDNRNYSGIFVSA